MTENAPKNEAPPTFESAAADRVGRDPTVNRYHHTYDADGPESFIEFVITTVSESIDADPLEMEPLYDVIEPQILVDFVRPHRRNPAELHFEWCNHAITLTAGGRLIVHA